MGACTQGPPCFFIPQLTQPTWGRSGVGRITYELYKHSKENSKKEGEIGPSRSRAQAKAKNLRENHYFGTNN